MRLLVTGATGFTGSYTVPCLLEQGHAVRCLVRSSSNRKCLPDTQIEWVVGDIGDRTSLVRALEGVDILINIASLGFGHAPVIVDAAVSAGIRRAVFVSTTALFTKLNAASKSVRLNAEQTIVESGLAYTILRPTMIYGSSRDRNMSRLIRYLKRCPIIPVAGSGEHLQQPVYVDDVAKAIVLAVFTDISIGKAYNISGAAPLSYNEVIDTIGELLKRQVFKLHLPAQPVIDGLETLNRLCVRLPIKAEQIQRLNEDKAFDYWEASQDFGYRPRSFREGITLELSEMGLYA